MRLTYQALTQTTQKSTGSMRDTPDYEDIPGTYVFDAHRNRSGYALNMFCMSLNDPTNRDAFGKDPSGYLDRWLLSPEQREAIEKRDWLQMIVLGGNIYYTFKLAAVDGLSMQDLGASMSGVTTSDFTEMMIAGGRPIEGNRSKVSENIR